MDVRTDHVHELLAFLYKPTSSKSRMFAVPIHISLPQGRCAHGSHDIRCIMGIADAHVRKFRNVILNEAAPFCHPERSRRRSEGSKITTPSCHLERSERSEKRE